MEFKNVEQLSEQYGWPLKIKARGHIACLYDIQPLNAGEKPLPVYRFPGGRSIVSEHEMVPADMEKPAKGGVYMDKKPAGRPAMPEAQKRKTRTIKMSDQEWQELQRRAVDMGISAAEYIRIKALGK
jgi:hypothetical protein